MINILNSSEFENYNMVDFTIEKISKSSLKDLGFKKDDVNDEYSYSRSLDIYTEEQFITINRQSGNRRMRVIYKTINFEFSTGSRKPNLYIELAHPEKYVLHIDQKSYNLYAKNDAFNKAFEVKILNSFDKGDYIDIRHVGEKFHTLSFPPNLLGK